MKNTNEATNAAIVLKSIEAEAVPLFKRLNKIAVNDADTYASKSEAIDLLKQLGKQAFEKEKSLTDPLTKVIQDIRELFKPFRAMVDSAEKKTKAELIEFQEKMEQRRSKIKADLESGKIAKLSTAAKKIQETEIAASTSSVRKEWKLEIVDVGDIPREYLIPNEAKIKEAFRSGKKVTGCKWEQKINIAI